jgi:hypothetical protein
VLLLSLYVKNYFVFGVFGATSWAGANLTLPTTQRMPRAPRDRWIAEGKLSPFAAINVFAPPKDYLQFLPADLSFPWPGSNELWRPSVRAGNFNHGLFLQVNERRRKDAAYFIRERPLDYLRVVFTVNLPTFFHSTTHWHPHDQRPSSSHHQHRQVLGGYERLYDRLVHSWPANKAGLYVFFPILYGWALWRVLPTLYRAIRRRESIATDPSARADLERTWLLGFCSLQITFVLSASVLFSSLESARYRYAIEPFIWIAAAGALREAHRAAKGAGPSVRRILGGALRG